MRTCKDCEKFLECLRNGDVVVNVRGGDHICEKFIAMLNSNKQPAPEVTKAQDDKQHDRPPGRKGQRL